MTAPDNAAAPAPKERLGQVVSGRYKIQQLLGEGGMGAVYLAEHTHMKKRVALKLLHPELSDNAEVSARFEREAMAAAHIEHPNVAAATDFGKTDDGSFFLVLEYLEGTNLRDAVAPGPLGVTRALRIGRQIALALERAHEAGIVHRDLKPENVMLVRRGDDPDFVKVLDFGIAKVSDAAMAERGAASSQPLTRMGTVLGTPEYMAPEQALGEAVTAQSDLYAVGVMLYEMLTGLHPFDVPDRTAMLSFHIVAPVPAMNVRAPAVDVPPAVEAVVRSLLEKERKDRPASARALVDAIDAAAAASGIDLGGATPPPGDSLPRVGVASAGHASQNGAGQKDWSSPEVFAKTSIGDDLASSPGLAPATTAAAGAAGADAGGPGASTATTLPAPLQSAIDTLKKQPRPVVIGLAAAVPLVLVALIALLVVAFRGPKTTTAGGDAAAGAASGEEAPQAKGPSASRLEAAIALGVDGLEALGKEFPEDPAVRRELALAYNAQGRSADAMNVVKALLAADAKAANDDALVQMVSATAAKNARGTGDADDAAFALLEGPFGERGVDALIELSKSANYPLKTRASKSLGKPEVRGHASAAAAVFLDLRSAQSCSNKRDLLDRAKESGDARVLPLLKNLKQTTGCGGIFKNRDCWPCLRKDSALDDAYAAVEARSGGRSP